MRRHRLERTRTQLWRWGTLTPEQLAIAEQVADAWRETTHEGDARTRRQPWYDHTADARWQNVLGAQGEIAFCVLSGRPVPAIEAMVGTWGAADVERVAIRTISKRHYHLLIHDEDEHGATRNHTSYALVLNEAPAFALIGWIERARAWREREWATDLPHPCWRVRQHKLWAPAPIAGIPRPITRPLDVSEIKW